MKTSTHLRKARALVNKGWCKGYFKANINGKECYCLFGALEKISGDDENLSDCIRILTPIAQHYHGKEFNLSPVRFNDHIKTTKKDVLAVFDLAIKKAVEDERSSNADRNK